MKTGLLLLCALAACGGGGGDADGGAGPDAFIPEARGPFPDGFQWGTAIAPYQVEGDLHGTDWYRWESLCATCSGDSADDGPDFWTHYAEDFAAAAALGNNSIRLGLEWARLFPTREAFDSRTPDSDALAHYHDILTAARDAGLQPMVTLIHFSLPLWIHDPDDEEAAPGWERDAITDDVGAWAGWAAAEFGDDVDWWITLNEPMVNIAGGWISGDVPPGKHLDIDAALHAAENMMRAHAAAYDAIQVADIVDADGDRRSAWVSIAAHQRVFFPKDPDDPRMVRASEMLHYLLNVVFLEAVINGNLDRNFDFDYDDPDDLAADPTLAGRLDYIGLNYYGPTQVIDTANDNNFPMIGIPFVNDLDLRGFDAPITDYGWSIYPQGFRVVLDELVPYGRPIVVTENGLADAGETMRPRFLIDHLYELNKAIDEGVDIRGYYHWSLIDNFEWTAGYCPRFGLFHVDFTSPERTRTMGEGAEVYRRIIQDNTVSPELFATYPGYGLSTLACPRVGL
jgi:beta-glucosidase/6-phospho-beta-glucosidase/beta-galactosidase